MNSRTVLALSPVVLALLIGVAFYATKRRDQANTTAAALAIKTTDLRSEVDRLRKSITAADQSRAHSATVLTAGQTGRDSARGKLPTIPDFSAQMNSPRMQETRLAQQRAHLALTYGRLVHDLHLSPNQIAQFQNIMSEHENQLSDLRATAVAEGLRSSDPAVRTLRQQADQQLQAAEAALLGDSGYQQAQEYDRTLPARALVDSLAGAAAFTAPLTAQQADLLTQALAKASPAYIGGGAVDMSKVNFEQADREAQGILSAPQFAAWRQMPARAQTQFAQALAEAMRAPGEVRNGP